MDIPIIQLGGPYDGAIIKATDPPIDHVAIITEPQCVYLLKAYRHTPDGQKKAETRQFYVWREMEPQAALEAAKKHWELGYLTPDK